MGLHCSKERGLRSYSVPYGPAANENDLSPRNVMSANHGHAKEHLRFGSMILRTRPPTVQQISRKAVGDCRAYNMNEQDDIVQLLMLADDSDVTKTVCQTASNVGWHVENPRASGELDAALQNCRLLNVVYIDFGSQKSSTVMLLVKKLCEKLASVADEKPLFIINTGRKLGAGEENLLKEVGTYHRMTAIEAEATQWESDLMFWRDYLVPLQQKLNATPGLFMALDNVENPIELTDEYKIVQYINGAYEQLTGCQKSEVLGTLSSELRRKSLPRELIAGKDYSPVASQECSPKADEDCPVPNAQGWRTFQIPGPSSSGGSKQIVYMKDVLACHGQPSPRGLNGIYRNQSSASVKRQNVPDSEVETPVLELMTILKDLERKSRNNEELRKPLQKIFKLLSLAELYAPLITRFKEDDKVSAELFEGLVLNGPQSSGMRKRKASLSQTLRAGVDSGLTLRRTTPEIRTILDNDQSWDLNIFELERLTSQRPLAQLGLRIFQRWRVREYLQCSEFCLRGWLDTIESHYHANNPYHNSTHAADVLHASAVYLANPKISNMLDHRDAVAVLIASIVHDLDHPGKTGAFLINTRHPLALLYNDVAVLESHHIALTFQLTLSDQRINIFSRLSRQDYTNLRKDIVDLVLATDMNRHFELLSKFQQSALVDKVTSHNSFDSGTSDPAGVEPEKATCRMLIKCADVSNPTRPWPMCREWAFRIVEEYFLQTEEEQAKGLPLSMDVFDRQACNVPLTQCRFIDMFVREMFKAWCKYTNMTQMMTILEENYKKWQKESEAWIPPLNNCSPPALSNALRLEQTSTSPTEPKASPTTTA